jgi:hypothetical protein
MSVFVPVHAVFIAMVLWYSLKEGIVIPPALPLLLRIAFKKTKLTKN